MQDKRWQKVLPLPMGMLPRWTTDVSKLFAEILVLAMDASSLEAGSIHFLDDGGILWEVLILLIRLKVKDTMWKSHSWITQ